MTTTKRKKIPEGSVRRTKTVRVGGLSVTVVLQRKKKSPQEKLKAKKAYQANKSKAKAARKSAAAKRTPKQRLEAGIKRAVARAVREGRNPSKAASDYKARVQKRASATKK